MTRAERGPCRTQKDVRHKKMKTKKDQSLFKPGCGQVRENTACRNLICRVSRMWRPTRPASSARSRVQGLGITCLQEADLPGQQHLEAHEACQQRQVAPQHHLLPRPSFSWGLSLAATA